MQILLVLLLPTSLLISVGAYIYAISNNLSSEFAITITSLLTLLSAMYLEREQAFRHDWNKPLRHDATDWVSFGVLVGVTQPLLKWASPLILVAMYKNAAVHHDGVFSNMPLIAQILVVLVLAELGKYWGHRLHHRYQSLWWLHSLHHGSVRLYTINNFRVHPLEYAIKHLFSLLPLMLLGASPEALLGYVAITQPVQMLQHANLPIQHGWLNYIFSTNELHRWHHSADPSQGNKNFGSALIIWDLVFGTFHYPKDLAAPSSIGLYSAQTYPSQDGYFAQVFSMFSPTCCSKAGS